MEARAGGGAKPALTQFEIEAGDEVGAGSVVHGRAPLLSASGGSARATPGLSSAGLPLTRRCVACLTARWSRQRELQAIEFALRLSASR